MDLEKFQKIIKDTYFEKDNKRGIWPTFGWLVEEVGELSKDIKKGDKEAQAYELGDVFAWLVSLANLLKIDVSKAIEKYKDGCPKCKKIPCSCSHVKN
jgi:NTP pyrophosphatase (non-canonical NTP hydrolase)